MAPERLDDDQVVVRGGLNELDTLRAAVENAVDDPQVGRYEITVIIGVRGEAVGDIAARTALLRRHRKVRQSTVGALRRLGLEPVDCETDGHCQVVFGRQPTDEELLAFARAFGPAEPNPAYGERND
jgi:hypothetical protein